jgi:predicted transcriptional regulator
MATEPVEINPELLERVRRLAEQSHRSVDDILNEALDKMVGPLKPQSSIVGLFADEPELVDQILDDVYRTREQGQLRLPDHE